MPHAFSRLFSPLVLGKHTLQSRIVFNSHLAHFQGPDGLYSEDYGWYLRERAKGGAGMVCIGSSGVHRSSGPLYPAVWSDVVIPNLRRISDLVHEYPVPVVLQLNHTGRAAGIWPPGAGHDWIASGPSAVPPSAFNRVQAMPHAMRIDEIEEIVAAYASAAARVREGGFDGVEILVGHADLLSQFLHPQSNRRQDKYGGKTITERMTILYEVTAAVRRAVGSDFLLGLRINDDRVDYSIDYDDVKRVVPLLEATGSFSYVSAWRGTGTDPQSGPQHVPNYYHEPGAYANLAAGLKRLIKLPVVGTGRINTPILAERLLEDGQVDLVGMVRALITDPHLPRKAREGRVDEIRTCLACNQTCIGKRVLPVGLSCVYNPVTGREKAWSVIPRAAITKKVVVVGGGPAGMEAARVAAERGHRVLLLERSERLGGLVRFAMRTPKRESYEELIRFFERQLGRLGVDVRLNLEATVDTVVAEQPDAVVVAVGADPYRPEIPGVEGSQVMTVTDVLSGTTPLGQHVVIIDTQGSPPGPTLAEYLADRGRQVEIVTGLNWVGAEITPTVWHHLYQRLLEKKVKMSPMTGVSRINENSIEVFHVVNPRITWSIQPVDSVVLAAGGIQRTALHDGLRGRVQELVAIGDCAQPRNIEVATFEGHKAALAF